MVTSTATITTSKTTKVTTQTNLVIAETLTYSNFQLRGYVGNAGTGNFVQVEDLGRPADTGSTLHYDTGFLGDYGTYQGSTIFHVDASTGYLITDDATNNGPEIAVISLGTNSHDVFFFNQALAFSGTTSFTPLKCAFELTDTLDANPIQELVCTAGTLNVFQTCPPDSYSQNQNPLVLDDHVGAGCTQVRLGPQGIGSYTASENFIDNGGFENDAVFPFFNGDIINESSYGYNTPTVIRDLANAEQGYYYL
jgi:hypothetical protein